MNKKGREKKRVLVTVLKYYQKKRKKAKKTSINVRTLVVGQDLHPGTSEHLAAESSTTHRCTSVRTETALTGMHTPRATGRLNFVRWHLTLPVLSVSIPGAENFEVGSRFFGKFVHPWRKTGWLINSDKSLRKRKLNFIRNLKNNDTARQQVKYHRSNMSCRSSYLLTYSMEQSPSSEANWFCS